MSIFSSPVSEIGTADLQELVDASAVENTRLEFKSLVPGKDDTLKKLSSFANTFGGYMIIGANADSADGRIRALPGVDAVDGYKQKVVQWCFDGASPPLVVEVSDPIAAPAGNDKVCYVVHVAESDVAPHFLNGRRGIWVRTNEFSGRFEERLANENELRHLLGRRQLITDFRDRLLKRAQDRFDTHIGKTHSARSTAGPILRISVVPRFPSRQLCEQASLRNLIRRTSKQWRGTFPDNANPTLTINQHQSAIVLNAAKVMGISIFEANVWGLLFYGAQVGKIGNEGDEGIRLSRLAGYTLLIVHHAGDMLRKMGYFGPVVIDTGLDWIRGVCWLIPEGSYEIISSGSQLDDVVNFQISTSSEELCEKPDGIAMDILRNILFSVNQPDLAGVDQQLENLVRVGYEHNHWTAPANS